MEFDLDLGQWIVVGLSAFLFVWYIGASSLNRRRGIATYRWLYRSLEAVGKIAHSEWIGSSGAGARLLVDKASRPFRRVEALYLLEPREFLPYWILSRLQGKRDVIIVTVTLRSAPKTMLEIEPAKGRVPKSTPTGDQSLTLGGEPALAGFRFTVEGVEDGRLLEGVRTFLRENGAEVRRISLRQEAPHLEIRAGLKPIMNVPAESFLTLLRDWFQARESQDKVAAPPK
jgi:hypothetical protein